jgi:cysteine-rich repeat protein
MGETCRSVGGNAGRCYVPAMRLWAPVATVLLAMSIACMRTPMQPQPSATGSNAAPARSGAGGGASGSGNGTGGATTAASADAAGAGGGAPSTGATTTPTRGGGGAVGVGGGAPTRGGPATGGSRTGGTLGSGGSPAGGVVGSGGRMGTGGNGASTGSGGRTGTGGAGSGGRGVDGGSTDASPATGGATASGGAQGSGGTGGTAGTCGDGVVDPGEQCDLGADNRVSAAFSVTQAGRVFAPLPLVRSESGAACYDYRSTSAHTGYEAVGASRILLYFDRSTFALSLIVFHGIDLDSTGENQPRSQVQMLFGGLPETTVINVADEWNELLMTSPTTATGLWLFNENTDGGVLGGLPFPGDWAITVEPSFTEGIATWTWLAGDESLLELDLTQPLVIESRSSHGHCRPDCTIPECGDGILDGGEVCDDGQPSPSGCSMNCQSFN